ncbi:ion channel nompc [Culex quinquefasciatus]|uniref:Ion channel nompc n=1 Tax=Culex quinquefasciatus TaxID=7176 RepID=B0W9L2_CULQU|nr:ion channel nompc [Culex quinquefasciatus]|eukprot:XP_001845396.1 ion channel nompc [Culex quinquefasciatus]
MDCDGSPGYAGLLTQTTTDVELNSSLQAAAMMGLVEYESPWWWYFAEINYSRDGFTREHGTRGLQAELVQRFFSRRKTISSSRMKWSVGWMMSFLGSLLAGIWPEVRPECDSAADQANGADVNYVNDKGKTPLQEAEATGNRKMVELLLERGANSDERKLSRQMPIVRRKERSFREIHEMMESTKPNVKRHPVPNSVGETYTKRSGTAAVGELFEKKLLTMVLFRLLHDDQIESFYLGTNVDETGAFDDVVLRTSFGGKSHVYCLQAKHRKAGSSVNFNDLINMQQAKGDFHLSKFYSEQNTEDALDEIMIREIISKNYECEQLIYAKSYEAVENWWKRPGQVPYLTKSCDFYKAAVCEVKLYKNISYGSDSITNINHDETPSSSRFANKFILITKQVYRGDWHSIQDESQNLLDFEIESQEKVLDVPVTFQGISIALRSIMGKVPRETVDAVTLQTLIYGDTLEISCISLSKDNDDSSGYYIARDRLVNHQNEPKAATGISDKVVIVAADPGMGKSTFLTGFAKALKRENPACWIVRINLLNYSKQFSLWSSGGHFKVVKHLLDNSASVDEASQYGLTALHSAAENGYFQIIQLLLANGADVNLTDDAGTIALHLAAQKGYNRIVALLEWMKWIYGHLEIVRTLLRQSANVNVESKDDETPLHIATQNGRLNVVQTLLENGADPNAETVGGFTPLHLAANKNLVEIAFALLYQGAFIDTASAHLHMKYSNCTPLQCAVLEGNLKMVNMLIEYGANVHFATENEGLTLLHFAAMANSKEIVTILLEHGCNVDSLCHDDKTPLHEACLNCNFDVAQVLLERGANAHHRTSENGFSLLHIAAQRNCPEIIQLLIDNGVDINCTTSIDFQTALYEAFRYFASDAAKLLVKLGADPAYVNPQIMDS